MELTNFNRHKMLDLCERYHLGRKVEGQWRISAQKLRAFMDHGPEALLEIDPSLVGTELVQLAAFELFEEALRGDF